MAEVEVTEVVERCLSKMERVLRKRTEGVVSLAREDEGWKAVVEVLERKATPDSMDLIGRYEVMLNEEGTPLGYNQVLIRRRQDRLGIEFNEDKGN